MGLILAAIVDFSWSLAEPRNQNVVTGPFMYAFTSGLFYLHAVRIIKVENNEVLLELSEFWYGAFSIIMLVFSTCGYLITFGDYWRATETRYFSLALGSPILAALIFRWIVLRVKSS